MIYDRDQHTIPPEFVAELSEILHGAGIAPEQEQPLAVRAAMLDERKYYTGRVRQ